MHAFTGVDMVSSFAGSCKSTSWKIWRVFRDIDKAIFPILKFRQHQRRWRVFLTHSALRHSFILYINFSGDRKWGRANYIYSRPIPNIKQTSNVFLHHLKRAILQCSLRTSCLQRSFPRQNSCQWGWKKLGDCYESLWSSNLEITMGKLQELIACKCKEIFTCCRRVKSGISCTFLCSCEGQWIKWFYFAKL